MLDKVTHTLNSDVFHYLLDLEVKKAVRYLYFFSLAIIQSDRRFEKIETEENLLRDLASLIRQEVRGTDIVGKMGSDTFFILLHQADLHAVHGIGNRIRERIEQYGFQTNGEKVQITISMGAASFPSNANELDSLIQKANEALTTARGHGGNRVCLPEEGWNPWGHGTA